jgi:serine/threonine protein phosphatase PrpC
MPLESRPLKGSSSQIPSAFVWAAISKRGGRADNEDFHNFTEEGNFACWVVADGLGGHQGGKAASSIAVETILDSFSRNPSLSPNALTGYLTAAQEEVLRWQKTDHTLTDMQTTAVVLAVDLQSALWGHVGDSRLYCFEHGRIVSQTEDHSVPQAMVKAGELSPHQIRHHKDRSRLLRALGSNSRDPQPTILMRKHALCDSSIFLLCTDGFWEHVTESEMEIDLAKSATPQEWLAKMEGRLLGRAPEGNDNYTALAVFAGTSLSLAEHSGSVSGRTTHHAKAMTKLITAAVIAVLLLSVATLIGTSIVKRVAIRDFILKMQVPWVSRARNETASGRAGPEALGIVNAGPAEVTASSSIIKVSLFDSEANRAKGVSSERFPAERLQRIYYRVFGINSLYGKSDIHERLEVRVTGPDGKVAQAFRETSNVCDFKALKSQREWTAEDFWEPGNKAFPSGSWKIEFSQKGRSLYTKHFEMEPPRGNR